MISSNMVEALNGQINAEIFSAYLYMSMSSYASNVGMKGAANWFMVQAKEEMVHAQKIYDYVNSQGERVLLKAIEQPETEFKSLEDMYSRALKHEKLVTSLINGLADLARKESDHATEVFLQWFVSEQVEEEESAKDVLDKVKLAGEAGAALFMIDKELEMRVFTPPAAAE